MIRLHRVYDGEPPTRPALLVDRLWPRGLRRDALQLDGWHPDVAPSSQLRRRFGHDPARWEQFRREYVAELDAHPDAVQPLLDVARRHGGELVLLYSARDREHNNAVVLRDYLQHRLR